MSWWGGAAIKATRVHPELDPEAAFLRYLAEEYAKFPSDIEGLRRVAFSGVEDKIRDALDALKSDALGTFALRRDNVLVALDGLLAVFPLGDGGRAILWRKRYAERMKEYGDHGETFSEDPESRYLKVAGWAKRQLERSVAATMPAQSTIKPPAPHRLLIAGIFGINRELAAMRKISLERGASEAAREAVVQEWCTKASRDIFSAVSAFLAIPRNTVTASPR